MSRWLSLFWINLGLLPFIMLWFYILRPSGPEKSFDLNKKYAHFLLPGKWKQKDYFCDWTRRLGRIWIIVLSLAYLIANLLILI